MLLNVHRPQLCAAAFVLVAFAAAPSWAQQRPAHQMHGDTARAGQMSGMNGLMGIPHTREGSGTSWLPDVTPMHALHTMRGAWTLMFHGNVFVQYINAGSDREYGVLGERGQFGSANWFMGMARRKVGKGELGFHMMASLEPLTVGKCGYPDLLATGEFCKGEPLHDRQHPHDLFMELAAEYRHPLSRDVAISIYGGPAAEPALGPVAYPHRLSAIADPLAPIGHHWQDATHIAFGVITAAMFARNWKLEGSVFNGREPDDKRYDFDLAALDSYSGRIWLVPSDRVVMQVSVGRLNDAEAPRDSGTRADVTRATASLMLQQPLAPNRNWGSTLVWGQNRSHGLNTNAFLAESSIGLNERHTFSARAELVEKSGEDLALEEVDPSLADRVFTVGKAALGYTLHFPLGSFLAGIGANVAVNFVPEDLERFYGSTVPVGFAVFASVRPRAMRMEEHAMQARAPVPGMVHEAAADTMAEHAGTMRTLARGDSTRAGHETMLHDRQLDVSGADQIRLMQEIHRRMMADPVIRERVATDPVLQRLMQRIDQGIMSDSGVHAGHAVEGAASDSATARRAMEFVTLLLSDPRIEARVHADPGLHRLWSDSDVQRCLETMRRLKASGQPLPAACPAAPARRMPLSL